MSRFIKTFSGAIKNHKISKHKSLATKLTVTLVESECPIVKCFIALATEETTNDGLPHTLEHLVFMGSDEYSKGLLDFAANQSLAQDTNAWTGIDHTVYTVKCAGSEGFLTFLPIYLDHVLFPTLTQEAFMTEIHHINEEGDDAGVAYCEMQSCENDMESLVWRNVQNEIYIGDSGYKMETGGIMENLRTTCTLERVKEYHKKFYRPENINIIICGKVNIVEILNSLSPIEAKLEKKKYNALYTRPWSKPSTLFKESKVIMTVFPGKKNEPGNVTIAWKGPKISDVFMIEAHSVLWEYLTKTSVSPFMKNFVDLSEPYCSSVSSDVDLFSTTVTKLIFRSTSDKQNEISDLTLELLKKLKEDGIDMTRIKTIINNRIRTLNDDLECSSSYIFSNIFILEHLYGEDDQVLLRAQLDMFSHLYKLKDLTEDFWLKILMYYSEQPSITSVASPCPDFMESLEVKEKERVNKQIFELGKQKLETYGKQLADAIELNDTPLNKEILSNLPHPNVENIKFHNVTSNYVSKGLFLHQADTAFCTFYFVNDTHNIPEEMKKYLPLLEDLLCNTHIASDDKYMIYEDVIKMKESLFFYTSFFTGICQEQFVMEFQFMEEDFHECKEFMKDVIFNSIITEERLDVTINKQLSRILTDLRFGENVLTSADYLLGYTGGCNRASNNLIQKVFLSESKSVIPQLCLKMEELQKLLFSSNVLHIIGNKDMLAKINKEEITAMYGLTEPVIPCTSIKQFREDKIMKIIHKVTTDESSYMKVTIPCPITSTSGYHKDRSDDVIMKIISEWVSALDGTFGRKIRGPGFAYNYHIKNDTEDGTLEFFLGPATDLGKAYLAAKSLLNDVTDNDLLDECEIELAKGAVTFDLINRYDTPRSSVKENIRNIHKGLPVDINLSQLSQLKEIKLTDVVDMMLVYHKDLFNTYKCKVVVCCAVNKFEEINKDFESAGIILTEVEDVNEFIIHS